MYLHLYLLSGHFDFFKVIVILQFVHPLCSFSLTLIDSLDTLFVRNLPFLFYYKPMTTNLNIGVLFNVLVQYYSCTLIRVYILYILVHIIISLY